MNVLRLLLRPMLAAAFVAVLASSLAQAQIVEMRPVSEGGSERPPPDGRTIYSISDDPDPFGVKLRPRMAPAVVLGSSADTRDRVPSPDAHSRVLTMLMVFDPATGALVDFEIARLEDAAALPGRVFFGADGYARIALPAPASRRR